MRVRRELKRRYNRGIRAGWVGWSWLILASACLGVLAISVVCWFQIWQNVNVRWLAQENLPVEAWIGQGMDIQTVQELVQQSVQENTQAPVPENALSDTVLVSPTTETPLSVRLEVPLIMQLPELPTGCEATATAMLLQYAGSTLTKLDVAIRMPYSNNPSEGFVGSPFMESGFTIYPQALMQLVHTQLGSAINLTGATFIDLQDSLQAGKPVCCWIADDQGYVHCVVITGYEDNTVYLNDPLNGYTTMTVSTFEHLWANNAYRALSY